MNYLLSGHTDAGTVKKINQDAFLLQSARWNGRQMVLAVLCDGMGGLEMGEVASTSVIRHFALWFRQEVPRTLEKGGTALLESSVFSVWDTILKAENEKFCTYGQTHGIRLGTTATALLFLEDYYYIAHVGDGRVYELGEHIRQLTEDQTVAASAVKQGLLTPEEAEHDKRGNILLQCIGAQGDVVPVLKRGAVCPGAVYLLCSDGFRHKITKQELLQAFAPDAVPDESALRKTCLRLIRCDKTRQERDNISVIAVKTVQEE